MRLTVDIKVGKMRILPRHRAAPETLRCLRQS
jgi:hypothetical protein